MNKALIGPGVTKTYKLTYESIKIDQALFNKDAAKNNWKIGAHVLRSFIDYFGANTEQLDMCAEAGRVTFTSYTEKVANGAGCALSLNRGQKLNRSRSPKASTRDFHYARYIGLRRILC